MFAKGLKQNSDDLRRHYYDQRTELAGLLPIPIKHY